MAAVTTNDGPTELFFPFPAAPISDYRLQTMEKLDGFFLIWKAVSAELTLCLAQGGVYC